jgi:hypothetical protein
VQTVWTCRGIEAQDQRLRCRAALQHLCISAIPYLHLFTSSALQHPPLLYICSSAPPPRLRLFNLPLHLCTCSPAPEPLHLCISMILSAPLHMHICTCTSAISAPHNSSAQPLHLFSSSSPLHLCKSLSAPLHFCTSTPCSSALLYICSSAPPLYLCMCRKVIETYAELQRCRVQMQVKRRSRCRGAEVQRCRVAEVQRCRRRCRGAAPLQYLLCPLHHLCTSY